FGFQVYSDFSGYSDIARGAAQVMGFNLVENFRRPFAARNIGDFWRNWHMSLFNWFWSYIYMPIAFSGNRSQVRVFIAIFAVFLASGFWHGAAWTFVVWGLLHGTYVAVSAFTMKWRGGIAKKIGLRKIPRLHGLWQTFVTFHLVTFSWIFFRASSLSDARYILKNMFMNLKFAPIESYRLGTDRKGFALMIGLIGALELIQYVQSRRPLRGLIFEQPRWLRWGVYYASIVGLFYLGEVRPQSFIYFQF
ncbi:MAG: MBOAT family protein, partial [Deltaproteobacteria bacterium]|nr:MBOAT family protein [Deltaproteobacteria bacterium]